MSVRDGWFVIPEGVFLNDLRMTEEENAAINRRPINRAQQQRQYRTYGLASASSHSESKR
jgi:hypothetical protein